MKVTPLGKIFKHMLQNISNLKVLRFTYCIERHKSPEKDAYLLVEWDNVQALWQICRICVYDVLEIL